ncbi:hypothetical protein N39L_21390 [Limnospira platensis NIES-39]|uniref:Transposase n=1 Tax=Limnospira platensis NIES-46 TaxID=1236695 RepID=A0A5M3T480_LIMPL|nr:hypothetical protein N39L_21390 [Arthrospira platensis NIES-39]GCE92606.1 hypothetical protein NIES46_06460 [Arthrospira platensis NIES-46]
MRRKRYYTMNAVVLANYMINLLADLDTPIEYY